MPSYNANTEAENTEIPIPIPMRLCVRVFVRDFNLFVRDYYDDATSCKVASMCLQHSCRQTRTTPHSRSQAFQIVISNAKIQKIMRVGKDRKVNVYTNRWRLAATNHGS